MTPGLGSDGKMRPSQDWPLSREEKLRRVLHLFHKEFDAANRLLEAQGRKSCGAGGSQTPEKQERARQVRKSCPEPLAARERSQSPRSSEFTTPISSPREAPAVTASRGQESACHLDRDKRKATSRCLSLDRQPASELRPLPEPRLVCSAARHGRHREVEEALKAGHDPCYADPFGNSLFHVACQNGNKRIAKLAIKYGGHMDAENERGNTGLHFLFAYGYVDLAEYFIAKGASEHVRNEAGLLPRQGIR
mmetsp:Transcript_89864/g.159876  ORF Transcript_89864/g.159876 Transcript_89864/m.159876 type:complete len:250 (+) Transcript_89864:99-848(+)